MLVELYLGDELVATGATGATAASASWPPSSSRASYRLVFRPADFFARVELEVALGDGHFHVPVLVSPYPCTTYRGS